MNTIFDANFFIKWYFYPLILGILYGLFQEELNNWLKFNPDKRITTEMKLQFIRLSFIPGINILLLGIEVLENLYLCVAKK